MYAISPKYRFEGYAAFHWTFFILTIIVFLILSILYLNLEGFLGFFGAKSTESQKNYIEDIFYGWYFNGLIYIIVFLALLITHRFSYDFCYKESKNKRCEFLLFSALAQAFLFSSICLHALISVFGLRGYLNIVSTSIIAISIGLSIYGVYALLKVFGSTSTLNETGALNQKIISLLVIFGLMIWSASHALWFHYIAEEESEDDQYALIMDIPVVPESSNTTRENNELEEFRFKYQQDMIRLDEKAFTEKLNNLISRIKENEKHIDHILMIGYTDQTKYKDTDSGTNDNLALNRIMDVFNLIELRISKFPLADRVTPITLPENKKCNTPYIQKAGQNDPLEDEECRSVLVRLMPKTKIEEKQKNNTQRFTLLDAIYFTTYTITTTGYGDIIPNTNYAKFITIILNFFEFSFVVLAVNLVVVSHGNGKPG